MIRTLTLSKQPSKKRQSKKPEQTIGQPVQIRPAYDHSFARFYSNYASVSHTPFELCIDFCTIAPPNRLKGNTLEAPVTVQVLVQPIMVDGLIKALQAQLQKYIQSSEEEVIGEPEV
jgi:hypothetical protein